MERLAASVEEYHSLLTLLHDNMDHFAHGTDCSASIGHFYRPSHYFIDRSARINGRCNGINSYLTSTNGLNDAKLSLNGRINSLLLRTTDPTVDGDGNDHGIFDLNFHVIKSSISIFDRFTL